MARIAFICTVIFILFAVTHARDPADLSTDAVKLDSSMIASESDGTVEILLPSEKPAESTSMIGLEKDDVMVELELIEDNDVDESVKSDLKLDHPVKVLTFTSHSRQFLHGDGNHRFPFRFSHRRPCRRHHRKHDHEEHEHDHDGHEHEHDHEEHDHEHEEHKHEHDHDEHEHEHEHDHEHEHEGHEHEPEHDHRHNHHHEHGHEHEHEDDIILPEDKTNVDPMTHHDEEWEHFHGHEGHEIPYGNDMILAKEDMNTNPMFHSNEDNDFHHHHHHHHGRPWFSFRHEKDHDFHHHHHHHHMDHEEDEHMGSSLMKSVRKFLNHLF